MQDGSIISPHPAAVMPHDLDELQGDIIASGGEKKKKKEALFEHPKQIFVWTTQDNWCQTVATLLEQPWH